MISCVISVERTLVRFLAMKITVLVKILIFIIKKRTKVRSTVVLRNLQKL